MHRLPTYSSVRRFQVVAILYCMRHILIASCLLILGYGMVMGSVELIKFCVILSAVTVVLGFVQWMLAGKTRCPLCLTPVLAHKTCAKNRNARRLLGSYRLRVALEICFRGNFTCQYCNESTSIEVRPQHRHYSRD